VRRTLILFFVFLAAVVSADRYGPRWDLVSMGTGALSVRTADALSTLTEECVARAFIRPDDRAARRVRDLLERFAGASPLFRYEIIDPDRDVALAREHGVTRHGTIVLECGGRRAAVVAPSESELAAALSGLIEKESPVVRFVFGHGERDPDSKEPDGYGGAAERLRENGFMVEKISLIGKETIPAGSGTLVLAGPRLFLEGEEVAFLRDYLERGGRLLLFLDPESRSALSGLLDPFGLEARRDVIVDPSSGPSGVDVQVAVVGDFDLHPATAGMAGTCRFPRARSVHASPGREGRGGGEALLQTTPSAWGEADSLLLARGEVVFDEGEDRRGPLLLGVVVPVSGRGEREGRLLLLGDSDFASNQYRSAGLNEELFLRLVRWMSGETDGFDLVLSGSTDEPFFPSAEGEKWIVRVTILLPAALLLLGAVTLLRRRGWR